MVCWSSLPSEIKHHVVKKLDFMSRHALRNTSRLDREIVDSTKCIVPRVRFGYKEGKGLIVVYTGIDKFLRLEMANFEGGVIVKRSENSYEVSQFQSKSIPTSMEVLEYGIFILKSLIAHNSIKINALEWDIVHPFNSSRKSVLLKATDYLGDSKIHVDEMVCLWNTTSSPKDEEDFMDYWKKVKLFRIFGLMILARGTKPDIIQDLESEVNGRRLVQTTMGVGEMPPILPGWPTAFDIMLYLNDDKEKCFAVQRDRPKGIGYSKSVNRVELEELIIFKCSSQCGTSQHKMFKKDEKIFDKDLLNEKCGVGVLCPKCADPFEYWFNETLPRRAFLEPFWNNIITTDVLFGFENLSGNHLSKWVENEMEDEKKEDRAEVASWGFKKLDEDVEEDSEEEDDEEEIGKMEKMRIQVDTVTRNIPYYMIIAILPVFLSFIVYFYYPILF